MAQLASGFTVASPLDPPGVVQRHPRWLLAAFTIAYFVSACALAARKLVWHDEIFTIRIAEQPPLAEVREALGQRHGRQPAARLPGDAGRVCRPGRQPGRLPAAVGGRFLAAVPVPVSRSSAHRCGRPFACLAVLFVLATDAHHTFAYEARPYGLLLGFGGLALLCWQRAGEQRGRRLALIGLALGLARRLQPLLRRTAVRAAGDWRS